jgi:hypothetical protein
VRSDSGKWLNYLTSLYNTLVGLSNVRHRFVGFLIRLRHFFEKNVTGFTYLFFAHSLFLAVNIYWRSQLSLPYGKTPLHWYPLWLALFTIFFTYLLPLLFILAAFLTFRYPKGKDANHFFIFLIVILSILLLAATL